MSTANSTPRRGITIDERLDQTRRLVRNVDLLIATLTMMTFLCAAGLLAVLADHWLFKSGLPVSLRLGIGSVCVLGVAWFVFRRILPLFLLPINPVYAAKVLEQETPTLKNTLVNWILLRRERTERGGASHNPLADRMFDGVTQTATNSLARMPTDRGVEWRIVQWWSFALLILLGTLFVYGLFSPKSLTTSLARLLLPFNGIAAPQTVKFLNVQPGNLTIQQGERLNVSVEVVGPSRKTDVHLVFSTDDGRFVRERIPMTQPEGAVRFEAPFPPGKQGIVCGSDYWIQRGDSRSQTFRLNVRPVAVLEVESLTYRYPAYTGLAEETVEHSGDVKAVEGTEVRLNAKSTVPLERASIVFDNDPKQTLTLSISGEDFRQATARWKLESDPKSTQPVTIRSYTFRATDKEGYESRRSGIYRIEILPDKPPVVQWDDALLQDGNDVIELPLNATLDMPFTAEDPDFGLRFLRFHVESANKRIPSVDLLESPPQGPTEHTGLLRMKHDFFPAKSRLSVGNTAELWIEAIDTKFPTPNTATTRRVAVKIIDPKEQQDQQDEQSPPKPEDKPKENDQTKESEPDKQEQRDDNNEPKNEESRNEERHEENGNQDEPQPGKNENSGGEDSTKESSEKEGPENKGEDNSSADGAGKDDGRDNREESGGEDKKPINPETNPGDAMQTIADRMKEDGKMPGDDQEKSADQQEQKSGDAGNDSRSEEEGNNQGGEPGTGNDESASDGSDNSAGPSATGGEGNQQTDKEGGRGGPAEDADDNTHGGDDGKSGGQPSEETIPERGTQNQENNGSDQGTNGGKREVPDDPDKKGHSERDDSLNPNSQDRSKEGNDASNPRKLDDDPAKDDVQRRTGEKWQPSDESEGNQIEKPGKVDNQEGVPTDEDGDPTGEGKSKADGNDSADTPSPEDGASSDGTPSSEGESSSDGTQSSDAPNDSQGKGGTGGNQAPPSVDTDVEEANLKYTEKVTNLVLEYLEDQMETPSPELLRELDWTKDQLRQFAEKWKQLSEQGQKAEPGSADAEAWKEALKSLGLKPDRDRQTLRSGRREFKDKENATETRRYTPPPALIPRFDSYTKGIGKE